jgi:hypothetical protein
MKRISYTLALAAALLAFTAPHASAAFGVASFDGEVTADAAGDPATQAGSHPFLASTEINFNTGTEEGPEPGLFLPEGSFKDVKTLLPAGLVPNPLATPRCSVADFYTGGDIFSGIGQCDDDTAVGWAKISDAAPGGFSQLFTPVYNLVAPPGKPALFGFHILTASIFLSGSVRTGGDYGVTIDIANTSQGLPVTGTTLNFWGVPADPAHDPERGKCMSLFGPSGAECPFESEAKPFLTVPTACTGPVATTLFVNSWQDPASFDEASFLSHDGGGTPVGTENCEALEFEPSLDVSASPGQAGSPSSLDVHVHLPQNEDPGENATAHLKKAVVELPEGVTVNAAAANGLAGCSEEEVGINGGAAASCPDAAKIGAAEIVTPLLEAPLEGSIYLAKQGANPFGSLLAVYLVAEADGIVVKLPGKVETDPVSGRVTATFDDDPQLPFSDITARFFGGPGGALTAPSACGTYPVSATLTPWSGTPPVTRTDSFTVDSGPEGGPCPNGALAPRFSAGTADPVAGRYSPLTIDLGRGDGSGLLTGLDLKLPAGLLAKLAGIPYCSEEALAAIPAAPGAGAAQVGSPACPAASQFGTVAVGAGAGTDPVSVETGKAYLAGPYKGAPLSLAVVVPALAGPFDLGNVVVRVALAVDPSTAQVEAISDPLPTILAGIPLDLRDLRVSLDRPGFTLNPTSCDPTAFSGAVAGIGGTGAAVSDRFQVGSCEGLGFAPKLKVAVSGGTRRGAFQALTAVLTPKAGQANLRRISVGLPHSEFLAQEHLGTVCTKPQFAADSCPASSVYGYAKAYSPLLAEPLRGPVYLRPNGHALPDLFVDLRGQIRLGLWGRIDSAGGGIRTRFDLVPDAPISKFVLKMKGGEKSLLVNSRDLCGGVNRATVQIDGQNGKTADQRPVIGNRCRKKGS